MFCSGVYPRDYICIPRTLEDISHFQIIEIGPTHSYPFSKASVAGLTRKLFTKITEEHPTPFDPWHAQEEVVTSVSSPRQYL